MNRRRLLQLAAALAVAAPAAAAAQTGIPAGGAPLTAAFRRAAEMRALADRCRAPFPGADTPTLLAACGLSGLEHASADAQLAAFASRRREDFRSGRIQLVEGWIMAHAECALCCLLAST